MNGILSPLDVVIDKPNMRPADFQWFRDQCRAEYFKALAAELAMLMLPAYVQRAEQLVKNVLNEDVKSKGRLFR